MTEFDVVGFGALNVDKLFKVNKIAGKDEESFVTDYKESCGGSAANTCVGLARLGLHTGFIGKVADDREGRLLIDEFRRENVDIEGITVAKKGSTGIVMGFIDEEGERALYVAPGVNNTISLKEINMGYVEKTELLHLTSFADGKSFESQKKLVNQLPKHAKVSFDPGVLYARRGLPALRPIVRRTLVMLPNEVELKLLTSKDYREGAQALISEGISVVGVKRGRKGCFVTNGEENHFIKPYNVKVVDTTGAGDAWNAGFLYGMLGNRSLRECGTLGNLVASRCITKTGARIGLPKLEELGLLKL